MKIIKPSERETWHEILKWMPSEVQDIHFWPEMMYPYMVTGRGQGALLYDEDGAERMMVPLLKRADKFFHPFNFGGPIATPQYKGHVQLNAPVYYATLNPFLTEKQQPYLPVTEYAKETVWVDLDKPLKFRQTTRHSIEKAEKSGAEFIQPGTSDRYIQAFAEMYNETMDRANAVDHWRFDLAWFRSFLSNLDGHAALYLVTINGQPECGAILLHGYGTCYYHFAASYRNHPSLGLQHFLVAKLCEVAKEELKCKRLHLGGGVLPRDGLFTFKSGFSDLTLPVYKYRPELLQEVGVTGCLPTL